MNQDIYVVVEHLRGQVAEISYIMLAAARDLAEATGGEVVGVLLGHNAQDLAQDLAADRVLYGDDPALAEFTSDAYLQALNSLLATEPPRGVLLGSTSIGADVAGALSVRLDLPLVSSCVQIVDGRLVAQICGGKIMAESSLGESTTLITMIPGGYKPTQGQALAPPAVTPFEVSMEAPRVSVKQYIEPAVADVDISTEEILVAVGRGIQTEDNIELAEELAELLGGVVCASRPIVDQGWLPTARMVGKSGKRVKSKLYLAVGISGAPEHVEGMTDAELVVAVNTDPDAPIFDAAKYGVNLDALDVLDALIEHVEAL